MHIAATRHAERCTVGVTGHTSKADNEMTSQRLRRLTGRRLVAIPPPAAAADVWLLVGISPELGPVELLTGAHAMLIPIDALLHPEAHQPDATRLHQLLTHQPTSHPAGPAGWPEVRFLVDATEALAAVGSDWRSAGIEWVRVWFELVGLAEAGMIEALVLHDAPETAEQLGDDDELPLPKWEDPELDPALQERVRALLAAEIAAHLAD
jgi:hypothetical protein